MERLGGEPELNRHTVCERGPDFGAFKRYGGFRDAAYRLTNDMSG